MKRIFTYFILLMLLNLVYATINFVNFDYKNEYLEPGKTYDVWVVVIPDKDINNTIFSISPYGLSKKYIEIIKGEDYEGSLVEGEKGVGHFIIKVKDDAPPYNYKFIVYCNYTIDKRSYSENQVFEIPVRGKPLISIDSPTTLKEGYNEIFLEVTNKGTGSAQNIKIVFNGEKNIQILGDNTYIIENLNAGITKLIKLKLYANGDLGTINYKVLYESPYNLLILKSKTESKDSETLNYDNEKIFSESGTLTFKIIPSDLIFVSLKNLTYPVGEICNLTLILKNNYKDSYFTVIIDKYYVGDNKKELFIKRGEVKEVPFKIKVDKTGLVNIPIKIYFDKNEINKNLTINIVGKPDLVLSGVNVEGFKHLVITGDLCNIGTGIAKSVLISLVKTENIEPEKPYENYFVGTLNPDDYGSFELHCQINGTVSEIPIKIMYRDENNNLITIYKSIKINKTISPKSEGKDNYLVIGVGILFLIGVIYLIYRGLIKKF
ncbi:COG1361 S-layer family protein [Methanocaldococcus infernus]